MERCLVVLAVCCAGALPGSACPDLAGRWHYREASGRLDAIVISQEGCERLRLGEGWLGDALASLLEIDGQVHPAPARETSLEKVYRAAWVDVGYGPELEIATGLARGERVESGRTYLRRDGPDALAVSLAWVGGARSVSVYRRAP